MKWIAPKLLFLLLLPLFLGMNSSGWAMTRPENHVWGNFSATSKCSSDLFQQGLDVHQDNSGIRLENASDSPVYLYCQGNPVNMVDPSGHDGDLGSLMMGASIGAGLDSLYNGGDMIVQQSLTSTIQGVQNGYNGKQILAGYLADVGVGAAAGYLAGKVVRALGDVIYGSEVEVAGTASAEARIATQETQQSAEEAVRSSQLWFCTEGKKVPHNFKNAGIDLWMAGEAQEGGFLFSTKDISTATHGMYATDINGVAMAGGSASTYGRITQSVGGTKLYVYKIKRKTPVAFGFARANGGYGKGGAPQYFIRQDDLSNLEEFGNPIDLISQ